MRLNLPWSVSGPLCIRSPIGSPCQLVGEHRHRLHAPGAATWVCSPRRGWPWRGWPDIWQPGLLAARPSAFAHRVALGGPVRCLGTATLVIRRDRTRHRGANRFDDKRDILSLAQPEAAVRGGVTVLYVIIEGTQGVSSSSHDTTLSSVAYELREPLPTGGQ